MNDLLSKNFDSKVFVFADDLKLVNNRSRELQNDLTHISDWCGKNCMSKIIKKF